MKITLVLQRLNKEVSNSHTGVYISTVSTSGQDIQTVETVQLIHL